MNQITSFLIIDLMLSSGIRGALRWKLHYKEAQRRAMFYSFFHEDEKKQNKTDTSLASEFAWSIQEEAGGDRRTCSFL